MRASALGALLAVAAWTPALGAPPKAKGKAEAKAEARTEPAKPPVDLPWLGVAVGAGIAVAGGSSGLKLGLEAGVYDLARAGGAAGLSIVVPAAMTVGGGTVVLEAGVGLGYRRTVGATRFGWYAELGAGLFHRRTTAVQQFEGYRLIADTGFAVRLAGGASYAVSRVVRISVEPLNLGLYLGTGTALEYAPRVGVAYSF